MKGMYIQSDTMNTNLLQIKKEKKYKNQNVETII